MAECSSRTTPMGAPSSGSSWGEQRAGDQPAGTGGDVIGGTSRVAAA
jgi:hypothetical protein